MLVGVARFRNRIRREVSRQVKPELASQRNHPVAAPATTPTRFRRARSRYLPVAKLMGFYGILVRVPRALQALGKEPSSTIDACQSTFPGGVIIDLCLAIRSIKDRMETAISINAVMLFRTKYSSEGPGPFLSM